jgi:SOS response regulatory protein OraA/RecX
VTEFEQFVFDLDAPTVANPVLSRHVKAGPARLLRRLVTTGLDPEALEAAAALVAAMDEEAAA